MRKNFSWGRVALALGVWYGLLKLYMMGVL